jgi:cytoskeletal protein CcmA (bactofilin family)
MNPPNPTNPSGGKNVLTSDVEIKGSVKFSGELQFDGKVEGEIASEGTLHLGENANVNGNINVGSVVVRGKVNGNVNAKDKIEIKAKAEVFGDVRSSKLVIEEGVTFVGKSEVNPNKVVPIPQPLPRTPEAPKIVEAPPTKQAIGR